MHRNRTMVCLMALADLLGMLSVDVVFDTDDDVALFRGYYCKLNDSLKQFPHVLRVAIPCTLLAAAGAYNVIVSTRTHSDILSAGLLVSVGAYGFHKSVDAVETMCLTKDLNVASTQQSILCQWHTLIAVILSIALILQLISFYSSSSLSNTKK
mmetsp:Transcript_23457/g.30467  ORF Transcript_23457/g.30467 Transcript_23457/m.30467 type:complete len:154 (-) Transcript_23457:958-1419(-)